MLTRQVTLAVLGLVAIASCSHHEDSRDYNRPLTYGAQCETSSDCEGEFSCLGPSDAGPYFPICTIPCEEISDCPTWNATGHCPGPITPTCDFGICDYQRCD